MEKIAYCNHCCDETEFETMDEIVTVDLKGLKFSYGAIVAKCTICKREVTVPEISDLNILRAYKAQKDFLEKE